MDSDAPRPEGAPSPTPAAATEESVQTMGGCLLRLVWSIGGPAVAYLVLAVLALDAPPIGSPADLVLATALAASIAARYLDSPSARPARGRYATILAATSIAAWIAIRILRGS